MSDDLNLAKWKCVAAAVSLSEPDKAERKLRSCDLRTSPEDKSQQFRTSSGRMTRSLIPFKIHY